MKKYKWLKPLLIVLAVSAVIGVGIVTYLLNMPHRDVQSSQTDFGISSKELVDEFLSNGEKAYDKYLDESGESKILEVEGEVSIISKDFNDQTVVLLKAQDEVAGVSCTFLSSEEDISQLIMVGQKIKVKGVIRSGANYDSDLEMYENVIMEKCDLVTNI
ncbi:hypothetical protein Q4534_02240 [Cyclobacterium sp. 1_MG-2023]|uniref:OB-fold protein n=1 Tax=Cyclobacterium sp. 1_MG-2023 TaxID=3062681 RepID=UPI0026E1FFBA|nr:hypothetical protein [Cyclobacterium sp. 1_MG-2023]MDO6436204.1 hypothetical protein [Cyclobacterium sp. 1_MG-2023]